MTKIDVPVVAISGHPGSGKTTLTRRLAAYFGVPALYYDDHETITAKPPAEVQDWIARGSDYDEIELGGLVVALSEAAKERPAFILLDTLLGRAHKASGEAIGLSLWLDVPADIALARKLREAGTAVGDDLKRAREFAYWIGSYTRNYERFIAGTYALQAERVRPLADVRLTRWAEPDGLLGEAVAAIEARGLATGARPSLLSAMERFGAGFGYERSFKASTAGINDDRYITTVHRVDLGSEPAGVLSVVGAAERVPQRQWQTLLEKLPAADVVHFGHEGGEAPVRKIYLEFVSKLRAAARAGSKEPQLLYQALKWRPGEEAGANFSHYVLHPERQFPVKMIEALRLGYRGREEAPSLRVAIETIKLGASKAGEIGTMFVEVEEEGTTRLSYDINVYPAQMWGRDMAPILKPMFAAYGVRGEESEALQQRIDRKQVGHVSVGIGRDGRDFVTVYYGLEAREPIARG